MNTGIVMDITGRTAVVMTRDGRFIKLKSRPEFQIGQEIAVDRKSLLSQVNRVRWMATTAAVLVIFVIAFSALSNRIWNVAPVVAAAYVSIDINPSVELTLDEHSRVISAVGLNRDGVTLLQGLESANRPIEDVMEDLIIRAEPYIDRYITSGAGEIVIASTIITDQFEIDQEGLQEKMKAIIERVIQHREVDNDVGETSSHNGVSGSHDQLPGSELHGDEHQPLPDISQGSNEPTIEEDAASDQNHAADKHVKVATFSVPKELREDALAKGISPGKLAVGLIIADKVGHELTLQDVETQSLKQIAERVGGLGGLLEQDKAKLQSDVEQLFSNSRKGKGNIGKADPASLDRGDDRRGPSDRGQGPAKGKDDDDDRKKSDDRRGPSDRGGQGPAKGKDDDDDRKKSDDRRGPLDRGQGPAKGKDDDDDRKKNDDRRGPSDRGQGPAKGKDDDDDRKKSDDRRGPSSDRGQGPAKGKDDDDDDRKRSDERRGPSDRGQGPAKGKDDDDDRKRSDERRGPSDRGQAPAKGKDNADDDDRKKSDDRRGHSSDRGQGQQRHR